MAYIPWDNAALMAAEEEAFGMPQFEESPEGDLAFFRSMGTDAGFERSTANLNRYIQMLAETTDSIRKMRQRQDAQARAVEDEDLARSIATGQAQGVWAPRVNQVPTPAAAVSPAYRENVAMMGMPGSAEVEGLTAGVAPARRWQPPTSKGLLEVALARKAAEEPASVKVAVEHSRNIPDAVKEARMIVTSLARAYGAGDSDFMDALDTGNLSPKTIAMMKAFFGSKEKAMDPQTKAIYGNALTVLNDYYAKAAGALPTPIVTPRPGTPGKAGSEKSEKGEKQAALDKAAVQARYNELRKTMTAEQAKAALKKELGMTK